MSLHRYLEYRYIIGNSSVNRLSPALDLSFMLTSLTNYSTDEYLTVDCNGMSVPPLACAFAKIPQYQHVVSVVDEDGFLVLYDTDKTDKDAVITTLQVHANAVFDLEWLEGENKILTGSGDQTIALFDVETCHRLETFTGHASSVKSLSCKVRDDAVFVSGSRDGHIMLWDKRIYHKDNTIPPVDTIFNAHMPEQHNIITGKVKKKRNVSLVKDVQQSVTVVLFQNENYIVSAGAADGCLKVWDIRKTYKRKTAGAQPVHVFHYPGSNTRKHGYSSLAQDSQGRRLFASCTDDIIYEYNMAALNPTPVRTWRGHKNSSFYVKSALSSNDQYLLSGSSDEMAYIWQINNSDAAPIVLKCHTAEVTSVAWCPNDMTKVVTLSDDTKTKFWRIYCREMKDDHLPKFYGRAERTSKAIDTSRIIDIQTPSSTSSLSATPPHKKCSLKRSFSANSATSPQQCLRTWLKRKAHPEEASSSQGVSPEKSVRRDECIIGPSDSSKTEAEASASKKAEKVMRSVDIVTSSDDSPVKSDDANSCSTSSSECLTRKRSHDESEDMSSPEASVFPITSCEQCHKEKHAFVMSDESAVVKRQKTEQSNVRYKDNCISMHELALGVDNTKLGEDNQIVKSVHTSPTKHKRSAREEDSENLPYQSPRKLMKLNSADCTASSPNKLCLTQLELNRLEVCNVRLSLFTDNTPQEITSPSNSRVVETFESDTKACLTPCPLSPKGLQESNSSRNSPTKGTFSCIENVAVYQDKLHFTSSEDFDSPTRNLPNLVMDQVCNTPLKPKSVRRQKHNWLTQIRLEKLKKHPEAPPKQVNQGKLSPKITKGMRKINSYFK